MFLNSFLEAFDVVSEGCLFLVMSVFSGPDHDAQRLADASEGDRVDGFVPAKLVNDSSG